MNQLSSEKNNRHMSASAIIETAWRQKKLRAGAWEGVVNAMAQIVL